METRSSKPASPGGAVSWAESARLAALDAYGILDTPPEPEFDDIARLAATVLDAPIAVVNLIAAGRQWFKAEIGIGARELPLDVSICAHAILQDQTMVVPDTRLDPRFVNNPLVAVEGGLRFYAGAQLTTPEGLPLGTVCVLDRAPRPEGITEHQRFTLEVLACQVMAQLELRRMVEMHALRSRELEAEAKERRSIDAALRDSEARYRSLFESLDAGFCIVELAFGDDGAPSDYRFVEVNPAFAAQTGLKDAAGRWMREIAPDHEQHWFDIYGKVAKTGEAIRFENGAAALDDRWFDVHAFRVGAPDARRVAILFNDNSERRRAENALHELNQTLDRRVFEAVAEREAAQDALRQSQKMEAIGQLTGGVAHDFNNLLTVIRGSVELLRRPNLSEERRRRYTDAIGETAERAAALTSQLLAFARKQTLSPELFEVSESLRNITEMVRTLSGSRIAVEAELPDAGYFVRADRSQFDTAIVNMAINARDAMGGEGRLTLRVGSARGLPAIRNHPPVEAEFVTVAVADTGSGIAPEALDRIFEPFYTTKAMGAGTGLGLSQVIGFAKQSGGEVRVESVVGDGATFILYLPRAEPGEDRIQPTAESGADDAGAGLCVLVVEDNEQVGDFATEALKALGYDSVLARDATQALSMLADAESHFQLVFSDVIMPGMSGLEMGQEIRRLHPGIPVILTSGYSHVLVENGSYGFELLQKPYSIEQLSRVLRKAIASPKLKTG